MSISEQIAKHLKEVHFGGNWTCSNLKDSISGVSWQQATTQVYGFNTIATLSFHINYYVDAVLKVLQGSTLNASDALSFNHPTIQSEADWEKMKDKIWSDAELFVSLISVLSDEQLLQTFAAEQYGSYYRNLHGIIEHMHYHLGQIVLIKKIILIESTDI